MSLHGNMWSSGLCEDVDFGISVVVENYTRKDCYVYHSIGVTSRIAPVSDQAYLGHFDRRDCVRIVTSAAMPDTRASAVIPNTVDGKPARFLANLQTKLDTLNRAEQECGMSLVTNPEYRNKYEFVDSVLVSHNEWNEPYYIDTVNGLVISGSLEGLRLGIRRSGLLRHRPLEGEDASRPAGTHTYEERQCKVATRVLYVNRHNRLGSLWTNMSGQTVPLTAAHDSPAAEGIYIKTFVGGKVVNDETILFSSFEKDEDLVAELKKYNIHTSKYAAEVDPSNKALQSKLADGKKAQADLAAMIRENTKLKDKLERAEMDIKDLKTRHAYELKDLASKSKNELDGVKSNKRGNFILDWFKALMGSFGNELRFLLKLALPIF